MRYRPRMAVTYVIEFHVVPAQLERFHQLLGGVLDAMREEVNFHEAVLHRDPADAHRFMLYETWADHDDVVAHQLGRPYREAWHAALGELLVRPRGVSMWESIRTDRRPSSR